MKDIPGYESLYAVTEDGRVWSYAKPPRNPHGTWLKKYTMIKKSQYGRDYKSNSVGLHKDGKLKHFLVHRLVALTYIPEVDGKPFINHKDGNPLNNYVDNLEWCTCLENTNHANKLGLMQQHTEKQDAARSANGHKMGPLNSMKNIRIFSMEQAENIRNLHKIGQSNCLTARQLGCSEAAIRHIVNGISYLVSV